MLSYSYIYIRATTCKRLYSDLRTGNLTRSNTVNVLIVSGLEPARNSHDYRNYGAQRDPIVDC